MVQKGRETFSEILIGRGILEESSFADALLKISKRFAVIADENVGKIFQKRLFQHKMDMTLFTFPPGEQSKTREIKQQLEDQLLAAHMNMDCAIIAMGGGVATDLGGFVAATFCRGVPLISIPTSLMGMVDASLGGKTGVNTPFGKNLIGAFYSPKLVLIDLICLDSLSEKDKRCGMAEVLKYGFTLDPSLLEITDLEELVFRSCEVKKSIIESDFQDTGKRRIFNFGHTIGHALELLEGYSLAHGDAVAIGMLIESLMSVELGYLSEESFRFIFEHIQAYRFPLKLPASITLEKLTSAMGHDKKAISRAPRFIVLKELGEVLPFDGSYCLEVDPKILKRAFERYVALIG